MISRQFFTDLLVIFISLMRRFSCRNVEMWSEIISTLSENWPDSLPHILIFYILFHVYLDLEKEIPPENLGSN